MEQNYSDFMKLERSSLILEGCDVELERFHYSPNNYGLTEIWIFGIDKGRVQSKHWNDEKLIT